MASTTEPTRLTGRDLQDALRIARDVKPGRYTLRELYGEEWQEVLRKRAYGKWFRESVRRGDLPRVRWVKKRSDKSHLYEVLPSRG